MQKFIIKDNRNFRGLKDTKKTRTIYTLWKCGSHVLLEIVGTYQRKIYSIKVEYEYAFF